MCSKVQSQTDSITLHLRTCLKWNFSGLQNLPNKKLWDWAPATGVLTSPSPLTSTHAQVREKLDDLYSSRNRLWTPRAEQWKPASPFAPSQHNLSGSSGFFSLCVCEPSCKAISFQRWLSLPEHAPPLKKSISGLTWNQCYSHLVSKQIE